MTRFKMILSDTVLYKKISRLLIFLIAENYKSIAAIILEIFVVH